jgi:beta-1,4-mannosyl-glycoprotein beta-1,4-N-acetylglucosaminyltransferase|tara:strand:+ start:1778 stop:2674 length:897 start_codon:yes stop_codon:yes gene_type:complete
MKIFDCFMFYDEELLLDVRMNILNDFVDYFIIVESKYFHNGLKRELKFDINNYSKFRDKIIYLVHDQQPNSIQKIDPTDDYDLISKKKITNAHIRENDQRNFIEKGLDKSDDDDLILISDVDEIPNLEKVDLKKIKNKIIMFEQNIFYYKFNRYLPDFKWFGTKACKKKSLINPQWLRNIKSNKYSFLRIDTFFSNSKYSNKHYIKNGGWHFSNLKNSKDIEIKLKSYLHHHDYETEELGTEKIDSLIKNNSTIYDMFADKTSDKYGDNSRRQLIKFEINKLPLYIQKNLNKLVEWID